MSRVSGGCRGGEAPLTMTRVVVIAGALALSGAACERGSGALLPPPGHVVVFVDTDAPVPRRLGAPPDVDAPPALFDTLRIDAYASGETEPCASCSREFDVDEDLFQGGASFTVESVGHADAARVRVRLYRSASIVENDLDPDSTVDVVAALPAAPAEGARDVTVFLSTDSVGRPVGTIDAPVDPARGRPHGSRVGSWAGAERRDCAAPPGPNEVCVPGGAFWMGHPLAVSADPDYAGDRQRLVVLAPFYLDTMEVDVAELRSSGLGASSADVVAYNPTPSTQDDSNWCTFTKTSGGRDLLPVNCIRWSAARAYCQTMRGGDLPTIAELEYASGALVSNAYVWGKDAPSCDDAVWGRAGIGFFSTLSGDCRTDDVGGPVPRPSMAPDGWSGPPRARDHLVLPTGDVFDLAGNVSEWALDRHARQDEPCWFTPDSNVFVDPVCDIQGALGDQRSVFGGTWSEPGAFLRAALRNHATPETHTSVLGFRCARPAQPAE